MVRRTDLDPPRRAALVALLAWSLAVNVWCATPEPNARRFWDERYGLENVAIVLETHRLEPASGYHPTLAWLPQALLLGAVEGLAEWNGSERLAVRDGRRFTPLGYLLVRLTAALFGTLSVLWVSLAGRRLFDADVALLAALLLAVVPWHIRQSAIYKPDAQLVFVVLVALDLALRALRDGTWRRYLAAGAAVGLAAASKYNGVAAALPLAAGGLLQLRQQPRLLARLAGAGLAAAAVFGLLNLPLLLRPELVAGDFGVTLRDYAAKGLEHGTTRLDMVGHALASVVSEPFHGPVLGAVVLLGLAWIVLRLRRLGPARRRQQVAFLAFPVGYVALYALATNNPSPHNWLPLVPFTALGAAFALVEGWRALRRRARVPAAGAVGVAAVAALAAVCLFQASSYAYYLAVPTTWTLADRLVTQHVRPRSGGRVVLQEDFESGVLAWRLLRRQRPALASEAEWRRRGLDPALADAVVARERSGADGPDEAAADAARHRVAAVPFRARGPGLRVVLHDWRPVGPPVPLPRRAGRWRTPPAASGSEAVSFELLVPPGTVPADVALIAGGRRLPLFFVDRRGGRLRFVSARTAVAPGRPLRVEGVAPAAPVRVVAHAWRRGPATED